MHRLFVAVRPPAPVRAALLDLMEGLNGARWVDEDQLHLTLRFIGEVDRHTANDVAAALASIRVPAFEVAISGLGLFDRRGVPTSLWAGIAPPAPVHALHAKVDQAIARAGVAADRRAFHPHVTLARFGRGAEPLHDYLSHHGGVGSPAFTVDSFALYESHLTSERAFYEEVERYRLDAPT